MTFVAQRGLAERHQRELDAGRVVASLQREVRPPHARRGTDRGQEVVHEREVQHLLRGDLEDRRPPATDRQQLPLGHAFVDRLLQAERREQVLTADRVLDLGSLDEHVDERVAMLDDDAAVRQ
jgi:hypothetical protein